MVSIEKELLKNLRVAFSVKKIFDHESSEFGDFKTELEIVYGDINSYLKPSMASREKAFKVLNRS